MQPYSIDFRQKIIEIYEQENISIRKLAQRFQVTKSFIQKLLKQYRETGELNPQKPGGSPPRKLQSEQLITLIEIIESNNDATLEELCELLEKKIKVRVSRATMGRITTQLNYSVKKNSTRSRKRKRSRPKKES
ncbi:transposase [Stanieria sp. NIES-3757]|nr:transposase [Stanieria sp. NIES-3757]